MGTTPGERILETDIMATMDFLNSDSIEQDYFLQRNTSTSVPSLPSSFLTIPFELIHGKEEDNACTAAPNLRPPPPCPTESFRSRNGKQSAQSKKKKLFVEIDSHYTDIQDEFADSCRSLSRRHRATHVHNLCEKRRRNRINEKMKDLQLLIPNSKKTDKASILDEAIEYVKQLQLEVQRLSSPNKMNPSHICVPMGIPCFHMPQMCMNLNIAHSQWTNECMTVHQGVQAQPGLMSNEGNKECFHTLGLPMFTKVSQRNNV